MKRTPLSVPEIAVIAGTRAATGAGIALLLADRLNEEQRRAVGWTLLAVGAITTIPIAIQVIRSQTESNNGSDRGAMAAGRMRQEEYAS